MKVFFVVLQGVVGIFLMAGIGYYATKRKIIDYNGIDAINRIVVNIVYPCFIFYYLPNNLTSFKTSQLWLIPLLGLAMVIANFIISSIFTIIYDLIEKKRYCGKTNLFGKSNILKPNNLSREIIALTTFPNGAYLPIPLVYSFLKSSQAEKMYAYIILFIMFYTPLMWSYGVYLLSNNSQKKFPLENLVNPPMITIITSLLLFFSGIYRYIPKFVLTPIKTIGDITIPIIMLSTGSMIGNICMSCSVEKFKTFSIIFLKLLFIPALAIIFVLFVDFPYLIKLLIVLEASMPPALSLPIIARLYGGNEVFVTQSMFYVYLFSILTIPFFYLIFQLVI